MAKPTLEQFKQFKKNIKAVEKFINPQPNMQQREVKIRVMDKLDSKILRSGR